MYVCIYIYVGNASSVAKQEREWATSYVSSEESESGTGDELHSKTKGRKKRKRSHKDDKVSFNQKEVQFYTCTYTFSCYMYLVVPSAVWYYG